MAELLIDVVWQITPDCFKPALLDATEECESPIRIAALFVEGFFIYSPFLVKSKISG